MFLKNKQQIRRITALLLCLLMAAAFVLPAGVSAADKAADSGNAESKDKVVRVGWYESAFNIMDSHGRRSGYAYEYQHKIAAYTGWKYEYVEGSWPELLQKLEKGEIDVLSDVSYTRQRADHMLYSSLPMGTEEYDLFVLQDNKEITAEDYSTLNGRKIGVNKGSVQAGYFKDWADIHKVKADLIELTCTEPEAMEMLQKGKLDAYVSMSSYVFSGDVQPLFRIGSSEFFFAVSNERPDLLGELDAAMSRIRDENRFYYLELEEKYFKNSSENLSLTDEETAWLKKHGRIRVGYQDNYLAFCASDPKTGELTGALKDYLDYAENSIRGADLQFEAVAYKTASDAMEAMKRGEVDCMFPANLTDYDSEMVGVFMTPSLMRTEMDAVVRAADKKEFVYKEDVTVAVNAGNPNYDMFLEDHYPGWKTVHYKDTPTCLNVVAAGGADCIIISNYRFNNIAKQCEELDLTTVYTGVDMDYCFAVNEGNTVLYSILSKVTDAVPSSIVNAALTYYSSEEVKTSFIDNIRDNLGLVMTVVAIVLLVIVLLLLRSIRAERKAREEEHRVNDLHRKVFVDALTSVRNKGAFDEYIGKLQEEIDRGENTEFAIGVFDCDNLKQVNDEYGHDKGDVYLQTASRLICRIFQHSPVFRIGGDEFTVVLRNEDFQNRNRLIRQFNESIEEINTSADERWEQVKVALGVAVYDPENDAAVNDTVRRADKIMYENKKSAKRGQ